MPAAGRIAALCIGGRYRKCSLLAVCKSLAFSYPEAGQLPSISSGGVADAMEELRLLFSDTTLTAFYKRCIYSLRKKRTECNPGHSMV